LAVAVVHIRTRHALRVDVVQARGVGVESWLADRAGRAHGVRLGAALRQCELWANGAVPGLDPVRTVLIGWALFTSVNVIVMGAVLWFVVAQSAPKARGALRVALACAWSYL